MSKKWIVTVKTDLGEIEYLKYKDEQKRKVTIVNFKLSAPISPEQAKDFAELVSTYIREFIKPENDELVALSGRGPIWLYMMIQHYLHGSVANLGMFDPKVGVIVIAVHSWDFKASTGEVIPVPDEVKSKLSQ